MSRSASVVTELLELDVVDTESNNTEDIGLGIRKSVPRLKIAILVVGTRGDVQPFLAIGKRLQAGSWIHIFLVRTPYAIYVN